MLRGEPPAGSVIGKDGVHRQSRQQLVDQDHRYAIVEALFDNACGWSPGHHDDCEDAIFEDARDQRTHVALCIGRVEQHALKTIGEKRCGERRQEFGMKRLLEIGAHQADQVRAGIDQALRQAVDAIPEVVGRAQNALARLGRNARARRESARHRRTGNAGAPRDVRCGDECSTRRFLAHLELRVLQYACIILPRRCTRVQAPPNIRGNDVIGMTRREDNRLNLRGIAERCSRLRCCVPTTVGEG